MPPDSAAADTTAPKPDTLPRPKTPPDSVRPTRPIVPELEAAVVSASGYIVQFAATSTEREARATLLQLRLPDGVFARIIPSIRRGRTVYRVIVGPFATRTQAERVARGAGAEDFFLYEGAP